MKITIADKSKATPDSGYLARSLTMALSIITITEEDCGTKSFLRTKIINNNHIKTLIGKWIKFNPKDKDWILCNGEGLQVDQEICVRSPIYCITPNKKICQKCFGEKRFNTEYLGILAGQILSEKFTQLTMRQSKKEYGA